MLIEMKFVGSDAPLLAKRHTHTHRNHILLMRNPTWKTFYRHKSPKWARRLYSYILVYSALSEEGDEDDGK